MPSVALSGQKTSSLPKGARKGSVIYQNNTEQPFYDLMIHVNDDSWDTPEFTKIRILKHRKNKKGKTKKRLISVVGGDLTESEHPKFDRRNPVNPGEKFEVRFWLNDEVGDKAHITVTPTDRGGGVIVDGFETGHHDVTARDQLLELIEFLSTTAGSLGALAPAADSKELDSKEPPASRPRIGMLSRSEALRSLTLDRETRTELARIGTQAEELAAQAIALVEADGALGIVDRSSEAEASQ